MAVAGFELIGRAWRGAARHKRTVVKAGTGVVAALGLAGCFVDQGTPPGHSRAHGVDVNGQGQILVDASPEGSAERASYILEPDGTWVPLGNLGGPTKPLAINDSGVAVGETEVAPTGPAGWIWDAEHGMRALEDVTGRPRSVATDIADDGTMIGYDLVQTGPGSYRQEGAWLWDPDAGTTIDLPGLTGPGARADAISVNDRGEVAGTSTSSSGFMHAAVWRPPSYTAVDLGRAGGELGTALGIDDQGRIVGTTHVGPLPQAIWRAVRWDSVDDPQPEVFAEGAHLRIFDVDDQGNAVGATGDASGRSQAVRWDHGTLDADVMGTAAADTFLRVSAVDGDDMAGDVQSFDASGGFAGSHVARFYRTPPP